MRHAENTVTINRPPAEVYAFLAEGLNNPLWRSGIKQIELVSGQSGQAGAVYRQVLTGPGGRAVDGDYQITTAVPGAELRFQVIAGPARPTGSYLLAGVSEGTRLVFVLEVEPKGAMKLMGPMIQQTMQAEVDRLSVLKSVLEGRNKLRAAGTIR